MLIINGGYPRSGTVLIGTIVCEILRNRGWTWQRYNPQERRELDQFTKFVRNWPSEGKALLIHTHIADSAVMHAVAKRNDAIVFWNHRDPRDVVVSLQQLHELPLKRTVAAVQVYARVEQVVTKSGLALRLRYEEFITNPLGLVADVARHMGVTLGQDDIARIAECTSIDRHRKIMADVAAEAMPGVRTLETQARTLREDPETLINDRHIQSGIAGRWRQELTAAEQTIVADALAPYVRALGYEI